jgi:hypothetical protein
VLYLPVEGGVDRGTYLEDDWVRSREVSSGLLDFLERLAIDIRAFVAHDPTHKYLVTTE